MDGDGKIDAGDEFLSEYSEEQKALHSAFISKYGKEAGRSVVFLFKSEVGGSFVKDGAKLGDMPINRKWGYMFEVSGAPDARTLAHELGHGRLTLRHTFAKEHCGGTSGHTNNHNLMDYPSVDGQAGSGTGLNRFQWETAHNPAPIGKVFQDDEDGAILDVHGLLTNSKTNCIYYKLLKDKLMINLVNSFIGSTKYHLTYEVVDNLISRNGLQAYGRCSDNGDGSITIRINSFYFDKVAPVFIAKTILHETLHASIFQKVQSAGGFEGLENGDFERLFQFYKTYGEIDYQHDYMAIDYVPALAQALKKFDEDKYTIDYYEAISWSGLHETWGWQQKTQKEKDEINEKIDAINNGNKECN